jgi:hypothetical protein
MLEAFENNISQISIQNSKTKTEKICYNLAEMEKIVKVFLNLIKGEKPHAISSLLGFKLQALLHNNSGVPHSLLMLTALLIK